MYADFLRRKMDIHLPQFLGNETVKFDEKHPQRRLESVEGL